MRLISTSDNNAMHLSGASGTDNSLSVPLRYYLDTREQAMIRVALMVVFGMSLLSAADEEGTDRKPGASGRSQPVTIEVIKLE